ncbi:MAG: serpin family protein [Candidatus Aminicenantes bacterium]|nr:serpin family protein [Candidatus Aminicenantes bacterium]
MTRIGKSGKVTLLVLLVIALLALACSREDAASGGEAVQTAPAELQGESAPGATPETGEAVPKAQPVSGQAARVVGAINYFAFDLYSYLKKGEPGNLFYSPFSLSVAMGMTYEGAREQTAAEIRQVFHYPDDINILRQGFSEVLARVNRKDRNYDLRTANALWAQKNYPFLPEYFQAVEKYYGGRVTNLDFVGDTENSRLIINRWVEEQTSNRIKDLIPQGVITPLTRLVLTNAIYFKGLWEKQFPKKATAEADFRVSADKTVKVPMMFLQDAEVNYFENEDLQAVELPYVGGEISMLVLLPKAELSRVESYLSSEKLEALRGMLTGREKVDIYLPRFKFETKYLMGGKEGLLGKMGMPTAFTMAADLSGLTGRKELYITEVVHQAFVEVNEEGTEAAAATAVIVGIKMVQRKPVFRADHPFIFIIQERQTGTILFLGRVVNPAK